MDGLEALGSAAADLIASLGSVEGLSAIVLLLVVIFTWSAAVKLRNPARAGRAMVDFGIAGGVRPLAGAGLGLFEAGLMAALVAGLLWQPELLSPVAWAATAALAGFAILIARSLARGERFACFCFGDSDAGISWATLARTLALAALAATVALKDVALTGQPAQDVILEAVVAVGFVGVAVTGARIPELWRWNRDPFGLRDDLWTERAAP